MNRTSNLDSDFDTMSDAVAWRLYRSGLAVPDSGVSPVALLSKAARHAARSGLFVGGPLDAMLPADEPGVGDRLRARRLVLALWAAEPGTPEETALMVEALALVHPDWKAHRRHVRACERTGDRDLYRDARRHADGSCADGEPPLPSVLD